MSFLSHFTFTAMEELDADKGPLTCMGHAAQRDIVQVSFPGGESSMILYTYATKHFQNNQPYKRVWLFTKKQQVLVQF